MYASQDTYRTQDDRKRSILSRIFLRPRFTFYPQILAAVWKANRLAVKGRYTRRAWIRSSEAIARCLENVGVRMEFRGMDNLHAVDGPVVFISNHMSTLETFVLPAIIEPVKTCTFVVKEELMTYPVFGPVMRAVEPIAVTRKNPKEDFLKVLTGGEEKLRKGSSIIIFPQTTRMSGFNPEDFNTLGIKLALRAGVPVIPIALKTDAWGNGRRIKDFGPVDPRKPVHIEFGAPMKIAGRGAEEHRAIVEFISSRFSKWHGAPGSPPDKEGEGGGS